MFILIIYFTIYTYIHVLELFNTKSEFFYMKSVYIHCTYHWKLRFILSTRPTSQLVTILISLALPSSQIKFQAKRQRINTFLWISKVSRIRGFMNHDTWFYNTRFLGYKVCRIQDLYDTRLSEEDFRDSGFVAYKVYRTQNFQDTRFLRYKWFLGYKVSRIQGLQDAGFL